MGMDKITELAMSYKTNSEVIKKLENNDHLVPSSEIIYKKTKQGFLLNLRRDPNIEVFAKLPSGVVKMLAEDKILWANCALDIDAFPAITSRVTIYGVPLRRAFKECLKKGIQKSRYQVHENSFDSQKGCQADLLLFVGTDKKSSTDIRTVQVWESVRNDPETFFAHVILKTKEENVEHLDCATMYFTEDKKNILFNGSTKLKGKDYKKLFRVDGSFPLSKAINLMRAYFPIEELTIEALQ